MYQYITGFFIGIFVATKYDFEPYVTCFEKESIKFLNSIKKKNIIEEEPQQVPVKEEKKGWF